MWAVDATQTISYRIRRTRRCLDPDNSDLADAVGIGNRRTLVFVDTTVMSLFGSRITTYFDTYTSNCTVVPIDTTERTKNSDTVSRIIREYDKFGLSRRRDAVVAIGGGVLTDVVGFASSIYRRGVPYVRVPTTLLGMVDAAVGVKTGINFNGRKNRLGTYFASSETIVDPSFLTTLPDRQISNGMAEVLKIALVKDSGLFDRVEREWATARGFRTDTTVSGPIIDAAITAILEELEPNLWEDNLARLPDFGHTFSPSLELAAKPKLYHGEAVAIDIALSCLVSLHRELIDDDCFTRIITLMSHLGLPLSHACLTEDILQAGLADSTRHRDGNQNIPLLTKIGTAVFAQDISREELMTAATALRPIHTELCGV
ncbi:sedoheptulose 7-phosphate cyclase [Nocardia transvalensis]|uniref:sedoheptulose 7-phosphate cyclase n=1 Tax=Nocardia transvalensis TaxID=37333 RepID=UPI001E325716|nr:sedoheptulose 7-phosphate cyclase [Nocardia transvalensis]